MNLNTHAIRIDGNTQRRAMSQPKLMEYRDNMKDGDVFPEILVMFDGTDYWLYDGFHRYHAMKLLGMKVVPASVSNGTLFDAQVASLGVNETHGISLTTEEKREKVLFALTLEGFDKKSDYAIAKLCRVSQTFVASVRHPEVKERQKANKEKSDKQKYSKNGNTSGTSSEKETVSEIDNAIKELPNGAVPDEDESRALDLAIQAKYEIVNKILESDDKLKMLYEENERLNLLLAQLEVRFKGLMEEKNVAVRLAKDLQRQLDKLRKAK